mmetsp:Transcript_4345/g.8563  ORF Transcript_4345/g.8563 Transcript_4345/m.8563 type:complete len:142 (-) Transcript_4345:4459-4884(-)
MQHSSDVPHAKVTRRETFCASHRLYSQQLSDEENQLTFGACSRTGGHGHNYVVEVSCSGPISPITGMVVSMQVLKRVINSEVIQHMDHRNLDVDVDEFRDMTSTVENVALVIWQRIKPHLPELDLEVCVIETEKQWATFRG